MGSLIDFQAAAVGFIVAILLVVLVTPAVSLTAWHFGILDVPRDDRRLHQSAVPRIGGVAIYLGIAIPSLALGHHHGFWGVMLGATLMLCLGLVDDVMTLHPAAKMLGLVAIACIPVVWFNIEIDHVTLPFIGAFNLSEWLAIPLTVLWIVAIANIINFIDGMDGLAAGFCAIAAMTFAILSASLSHPDAAAISAIVAGACIGFLRYNFHPASIIMGDSGALMLGYLLATIAIQGVLKTAAAVSLVFPLVVLALPILDTSFVILKRMKYRRPIYQADRSHFHHRFASIGFSQRRTALTLYAWCLTLSAFALAVRFVPNHRRGWTFSSVTVLGLLGLIAVATSLYVIYTLEILKVRHLRAMGLWRARGAAGEPPDDAPEDPSGRPPAELPQRRSAA